MGAPTALLLPCVSGGSSSCRPLSSGLSVTGAPAWARGHSSGGVPPPRVLWRASGGGGYVPRLEGSWLAEGGGGGCCLPLWSLRAGEAWCRGEAGQAGRLGVPYAVLCSSRPRLSGGESRGLCGSGRPGVRWRLGWHVRLCVSCRRRVPRPPRPLRPTSAQVAYRRRVGQGQRSRPSWGASPPHVPARGRLAGASAQAQGVMACVGKFYCARSVDGGVPLLPSVSATRALELGPRYDGQSLRADSWLPANTPGRTCYRPWVPPSPAAPLLWWLGLRWRRVPRAVAPVDECGAQGQGQPDIGLRVRNAEHRSPLQEGRPPLPQVGSSCAHHRPQNHFGALLGHPPPWGHLPVPPVPPELHDVQRPVPLVPRGCPCQPPLHLKHHGEDFAPWGVGDGVPVPHPLVPGLGKTRATTAPSAGSARGSCATGAAAIRTGSALGSRAAGAAAVCAG